jgi:hypothetical protein
MPIAKLNLNPNLTKLQGGVEKVLTGQAANPDTSRIMPRYSSGVLKAEGLLSDAKLAAVGAKVNSDLNNAKALMNKLGFKDVTQAPAIKLSSHLATAAGLYQSNLRINVVDHLAISPGHPGPTPFVPLNSPGFSPNSAIPVNTSVIIASTLDLTNTTLTIKWPINTLTIIVNTLTCLNGALINYDDSAAWNPPTPGAPPQAANGTSYNPYAYGGGGTDGPNGGNGANGQPGGPQNMVPPAAPSVQIYALNINGMPAINLQGLKGAKGYPGQMGGNGGNGGAGKNGSDAWPFGCTSQPGHGGNGGSGGRGGDGGTGGQGGAGGSILVATTQNNWNQYLLNHSWSLNIAGGPGGDPGPGGSGGAFGQGAQAGTPGGAGQCNKYGPGAQGQMGGIGNPGGDGRGGNSGLITPDVITEQEWEEELTLPFLYTINPSQGFAGTAISGTGINFGPGDAALINGQSVPATFPAAGQVNLTIPSNQAGGYITVAIRRAADGAVSSPVNFNVLPALSALNVTPTVGKVPMLGNPGSTVTITADGLVAGSKVTFGVDTPVPLTPAAPWAPPGVTFTTPPLTFSAVVPPTAASGDLTITSPTGQVIGKFSYPIDNFRNTRGFSWDNTGQFQTVAGNSYSYDDATALFGASQTQVDVLGVNIAGPFVNLFITLANAFLDAGGQCFGMSLSSILFADSTEAFGAFSMQPVGAEPSGPPAPNVWLLNGPAFGNGQNVDPALATFVHQRHLAQLSQEALNCFLSFHLNITSAAQLRSYLEQCFAEGVGAIVSMEANGDGHAVVGYGIVDTGNGNFNVLLYNPNVPFTPSEDSSSSTRASVAAESVLSVTSNGTWTLNNSTEFFSPPVWTGGIGSLTVIPGKSIGLQPTFPWAEMIAGALVVGGLLVWFVGGDASVSQVSDGLGHTLLSNGQWNQDPNTMLSGVRRIPNLGGLGKALPPAFVSNRAGALLHTITGKATGNYSLYLLGGGGGVNLSNVPTAQGATDLITVTPGQVGVTTDTSKALNLAILGHATASKLPRTGTFNTTAPAGVALNFAYDPSGDSFSYTHSGPATSYTLGLSTIDSQGKAVEFTTQPVQINTGETHTIAPTWEQLSSGTGTLQVRNLAGAVQNNPLR